MAMQKRRRHMPIATSMLRVAPVPAAPGRYRKHVIGELSPVCRNVPDDAIVSASITSGAMILPCRGYHHRFAHKTREERKCPRSQGADHIERYRQRHCL